jgi:hypothetical protein
MQVTGAILQRYYNLPKTKFVGRVGQASPPAMEKPSIAGETPALQRQNAILCKLVQG